MIRFSRPIQIYIALVTVAGTVAFGFAMPQFLGNPEWVLLATLVASGTLAGMYTFPMVYGRLWIDLSGAVLLMAVFLGNIPLAILVAATVSVIAGVALRRRRLWNILFNASTEVLGIGIAALVYHNAASPTLLPLDSWNNALALVLSAGSYWITNSALVTVLVASRNGEPFFRNYINNWSEFYIQCTLLTLLAVLGTAAWHQGAAYAFLLFVPTVAVYHLLSLSKIKQEQVIHSMEIIAEVLDRRNPFTFQHSRRVAEHAVKIARRIELTATDVDVLHRAALIHDIGKLGVEDPSHDHTPGRSDLTDYQFYSLKQHAQLGAMIAREIPAFEECEEPIRYHHDWFDGQHASKPHSGDEIPLGARIIAVADSYDLLCMTNGEATLAYDPVAVEKLQAMSARQLDPELLAAFLEILGAERGVKIQTVGMAQQAAVG